MKNNAKKKFLEVWKATIFAIQRQRKEKKERCQKLPLLQKWMLAAQETGVRISALWPSKGVGNRFVHLKMEMELLATGLPIEVRNLYSEKLKSRTVPADQLFLNNCNVIYMSCFKCLFLTPWLCPGAGLYFQLIRIEQKSGTYSVTCPSIMQHAILLLIGSLHFFAEIHTLIVGFLQNLPQSKVCYCLKLWDARNDVKRENDVVMWRENDVKPRKARKHRGGKSSSVFFIQAFQFLVLRPYILLSGRESHMWVE